MTEARAPCGIEMGLALANVPHKKGGALAAPITPPKAQRGRAPRKAARFQPHSPRQTQRLLGGVMKFHSTARLCWR
jgi:hypothetical protein